MGLLRRVLRVRGHDSGVKGEVCGCNAAVQVHGTRRQRTFHLIQLFTGHAISVHVRGSGEFV